MDEARRAAVAAMLGARSVAVVGASAAPRQLRRADDHRGATRFGPGASGEPALRPDRRTAVRCRRSPTSTSPSTWCCSASPTPRCSTSWPRPRRRAHVGGAVRVRHTGCATRSRRSPTDAGMAVCGAGCMGFVNNALGVRALGYLEPDPLPTGGVSLVTHSGSAFSTLLRARRGFGFRLAVSSGQELVTDTADYVDYALDDPDTRIVALLLETPRVGSPAARRRCCAPPSRTCRWSSSPSAVRRGDARWSPRTRAPWPASARRGRRSARRPARCTSAIWPSSPTPSSCSRPGVAASRGGIATVHDSGAERALVADLAHELGVDVRRPGRRHAGGHRRPARRRSGATNPLDVWGTGADTRDLFGACLRAMVDDPGVAVTALAVDLVTEFDGDTAYADAVLDVAPSHRRADGGDGVGAVGDRRAHRANGCGTAGFRSWRAPAAGWRRSDTSRAGRCRCTGG